VVKIVAVISKVNYIERFDVIAQSAEETVVMPTDVCQATKHVSYTLGM